MNDDQFKKRITLLYIFFGKLETTEISQSPNMSPADLVGNVGGLLGNVLLSLVILTDLSLISYFISKRPLPWPQSPFFNRGT